MGEIMLVSLKNPWDLNIFPFFLDIYSQLSLVPRIALMTTLQGANDPSKLWPIRRPECCNLDQWEAWTGSSDTRRYQACNAARQPLTYEQLITKQNGLARGESWQYWSKILCDLVPSLWFPASKGFKFDLVWIYWGLWSPTQLFIIELDIIIVSTLRKPTRDSQLGVLFKES